MKLALIHYLDQYELRVSDLYRVLAKRSERRKRMMVKNEIYFQKIKEFNFYFT